MKSTFLTATTFVAVAALGGVAGATLSGGSSAPAALTGTAATPVEVRTQVVRRTVRVVRHVHVRHRHRAVAAPTAAPAAAPVSRPVVAAAPTVAKAPSAAPVAAPAPRVVTRTSGAATRGTGDDHGSDDGHEHENGDD